tara:strand:+ start:1001 stop:1642 length:642 start_codon:yes stop_codon:yes gene_type:complete
MFEKQYLLKQLVSSDGSLFEDSSILALQETLALEVMESFLGSSILIGDQKFILSNLELYYGGIGDMAHDWYRSSFPDRYTKKSKHSKVNTDAQISKGPIFYFNQKGQGRFKRCDIVIGNEGVAVSFLIRNVLDSNLDSLGTINGQPNVVLKKMGLTDQDHMQNVELIDTKSDVLNRGFKIQKLKRFTNGKFNGFDYDCPFARKEWNYRLVKST